MKHIKRLWVIIGGSSLLLLCMLFGAFFAGPLMASAQSTQNTATPTTSTSNPYCTLYDQNLAKSLNVSTTTLNQDRQNAANSVLAQMVKDGKLTQAQATKIEQNRAKKQTCTSFNAHTFELRVVRQYLLANRTDLVNLIAPTLNLKSSDLVAQLKSGKTLDQIAKAQNVTAAKLQSAIQTAVTTEVNKGETSGTLTKDQVSAFQQYVTTHSHLWEQLAAKHWAKKAK
jgi:polyhydroxyalkanoate synthesis regulator phasin